MDCRYYFHNETQHLDSHIVSIKINCVGRKMAAFVKFVCALIVLAAVCEVSVATITGSCGYKGGCHNGHCWAYCDVVGWCYTFDRNTDQNRWHPQKADGSTDYLTCDKDSDCDPCWKCNSMCI